MGWGGVGWGVVWCGVVWGGVCTYLKAYETQPCNGTLGKNNALMLAFIASFREITEEEAACSHIPPPQLPPRPGLSNGVGAEMPGYSTVGRLNVENGSSSDTDEERGRSSWSPVPSHQVCACVTCLPPCITPLSPTLVHLHSLLPIHLSNAFSSCFKRIVFPCVSPVSSSLSFIDVV